MGTLTHFEEPVVRCFNDFRGELCSLLRKLREKLAQHPACSPSLVKLMEEWESQYHELTDEFQEAVLGELLEEIFGCVIMPKCPKCGEEIDRLYYKVVDYGVVWVKENGELDWELASETYGDEQKSACDFECPKCHAIIFDDEDEAVEFLTS